MPFKARLEFGVPGLMSFSSDGVCENADSRNRKKRMKINFLCMADLVGLPKLKFFFEITYLLFCFSPSACIGKIPISLIHTKKLLSIIAYIKQCNSLLSRIPFLCCRCKVLS